MLDALRYPLYCDALERGAIGARMEELWYRSRRTCITQKSTST